MKKGYRFNHNVLKDVLMSLFYTVSTFLPHQFNR